MVGEQGEPLVCSRHLLISPYRSDEIQKVKLDYKLEGSIKSGTGGGRERGDGESISDQFVKSLRMLLLRHHSAVIKDFQTRLRINFQEGRSVLEGSGQVL